MAGWNEQRSSARGRNGIERALKRRSIIRDPVTHRTEVSQIKSDAIRRNNSCDVVRATGVRRLGNCRGGDDQNDCETRK